MKALNWRFALFAISILCWAVNVYSQESEKKWFPFQPSNYYAPGTLDLSHWLDAPAGKHGFVQMKGEDLVFENGEKVKFWGTNIASEKPFMKPEEAKVWTQFLAKYGFNAVRFHKFTWKASDGIHSTVITNDKWQNFDFLCNELRSKGIYYGWSHIYGHKVRPGDSTRLIAYDEIANTKFPWAHLNGTTASLVNYAEDLQELNIELTVNMLKHVNPHTGLKYADDPALSFIELQNEDNIFWGAIERTLEQTPTYRALLNRKFSDWLTEKYKTQENLVKAWNNEGLAEGESLEKENIYPSPNHGLFSHEYQKAVEEKRAPKQHLVDKITFLYEEQQKFYDKFVKAIRDTGYKGVIVASCWQAGTGLSHLYNLYSDAQVGMIDRHNYFGGGTGHSLQAGRFNNAAMVSSIGSGLLGAGLQQVSDRPFAFSEWMSLIPNEWTAESAPIIAAYGLGLQGWDASFSFATDHPEYTSTIQTPPHGGIYNTTSPTQLALYPALAMMIYRNDVEEGETVVNRKIDFDALKNGEAFFDERVIQDHDRKVFKSSFPLEALAAGKVTLSFEEGKDLIKDMENYKKDDGVLSNTGQLFWKETGKGYFTIDTEGTKGLVGFAPGQNIQLNGLNLSTSNEFAVILVSSLDKEQGLHKAKNILITTMARARNSGMEYNEDKTMLEKVGSAPIELEPVNAEIKLNRKGKYVIHVLDHVGNRTGKTLSPKGRVVKLNGEETKAIYYEVEFKK